MFTFEEQEWMRANEHILTNSDLDTIYKAARGENFSDNFPSNLIIRIAIQRGLKFSIYVNCSSITYTEIRFCIMDFCSITPIILAINRELTDDEAKEELKNHLVNNFGFTPESVETLIYSKLALVGSNRIAAIPANGGFTIGSIPNSVSAVQPNSYFDDTDSCISPVATMDKFSELEKIVDELTKKIDNLEGYTHYLEDKLMEGLNRDK